MSDGHVFARTGVYGGRDARDDEPLVAGTAKKRQSCEPERAMPADGRFGGHIVAGHVDGMGRIIRIERDDTAIWYTIQADPAILRYIVEKGSIAIDGVSLTVAKVTADSFAISAIPHTVQNTILSERRKGDLVNLENDMIGKYVEKLLNPAPAQRQESRLTRDFLSACGYDYK